MKVLRATLWPGDQWSAIFRKLCNKQILGKTEESLCWSSDERPCGQRRRIQMTPNLETVLEPTIVILYQIDNGIMELLPRQRNLIEGLQIDPVARGTGSRWPQTSKVAQLYNFCYCYLVFGCFWQLSGYTHITLWNIDSGMFSIGPQIDSVTLNLKSQPTIQSLLTRYIWLINNMTLKGNNGWMG